MKIPRHRIATIGSLVFLLTLAGVSSRGQAQGRQVIFSVTGDVPYSSGEVKTLKKQIENHNKYSPAAFLVHVGDILSGGAPCNESVYSQVAGILKGLAVPAYIVPGDNETLDCKSASSGMNFFLKHFQEMEQSSCNAPVTERQSGRPENWAFTLDGVLFIGIDLVYSAKGIEKQAAEWVQQQMEAKGAQVRAAAVFAHFDPNVNSSFSKPFRSAAKTFGKPVLFAHGHGHSWSTSFPFPEKNIFRMQVDMGGSEDPVQVTVTMDVSAPAKTFLLKRKPWSGKIPVTQPPCVNAGADQTIAAAATLQGSVSNSVGDFTTVWSQESGPAAAMFDNANALTTTVNFSAPGTYMLRLTAESGALRKSDEVKIVANGGVNNYSLTANTAGSGQVALNPTGGIYVAGKVVTMTATPAVGFQFSGWSGDLNDLSNPITLAMNGNKTVTATFTASPPSQHTLTVNKVGSGSVALNSAGSNGAYPAGTVVTLTAASATGFKFSGWSGDLSGTTNPITLTMNGNKTVMATFMPLSAGQYNLSVNKTGSGSVAINPASASGVYDKNTVVTLTATPADGFQFDRWSDYLSGSFNNPATITMDAHKTVTAIFAPLVVHEQTKGGSVSNSATVTTTGKLTAANGNLYLAAISMRPKTAVASISGLGLTWKLVRAKCSGRNTTAIEVWMAQGTPTGDTEVTATFATVPNTAVIAVSRYSNVAAVNPLGNIIAGNTNGMNTNGVCSDGVDQESYSFNLTATKNGAMVYEAVAAKAMTHTPGAGYLKRGVAQVVAGLNTSSVAVADKAVVSPAIFSVDGVFSGVTDWAIVAFEIKPAVVAPANAEILAKQQEQLIESTTALPDELVLHQNYPNPFNPSTQIGFSLPKASPVNIKVYNLNGVEVATVVDDNFSAGTHAVTFQPQQLSSGTYFYVMQAGTVRQVRRLMLVK